MEDLPVQAASEDVDEREFEETRVYTEDALHLLCALNNIPVGLYNNLSPTSETPDHDNLPVGPSEGTGPDVDNVQLGEDEETDTAANSAPPPIH